MTRHQAITPRSGEPLSRWTSLGLGGPARHFVVASTTSELEEALRWAEEKSVPARILGGGSNLVVSDHGVDGLVIRLATSGVQIIERGADAVLTAAAGATWDEVVAESIEAGLAGLECLSGIPGTVGATPIQNVGAYGVETADVLEVVRVIDRVDGVRRRLVASECAFGYRTSRFRRHPDRFVVTDVDFKLQRHGRPVIRYPELERAVAGRSAKPTPADVRAVVLDLRRGKGMVLEETLPGSVGSFFINPVLDPSMLVRIERALSEGQRLPRYPVGEGRVKVPAAWLIENAGFGRGIRYGAVGVSEHHALALVHHGGGSTTELLQLAGRIQARVLAVFGIELLPEPVFWGISDRDLGEV